MIRLGAQVSQARGYEVAIREAGDAGLRALQVFSRSPVGGQSKGLPKANSLKPVLRAAGIEVLYVHAPYFVNPAALDSEKLQRARSALKQEMRRAKRLSGDYVVLHPGHWQTDLGREAAKAAFVGTVVEMLEAPGRVLIENTAGQGRELGATWEELGAIFQSLGLTRRVGLMLDTAHAMASGHPLKSRDDTMKLFELIEKNVGVRRVAGIHLNDSLYPVGSHRDRHAHLLEGVLGAAALQQILVWAKDTSCPLILETPGRDIGQRTADLETIEGLSQEV